LLYNHIWNYSANCLQDNSSARITQKTQRLYCYRGVFTTPLHINGPGADHTENTVLLLLCAWMLQALPSNGGCLQSHCLATGLYSATCYVFGREIRKRNQSEYRNAPVTHPQRELTVDTRGDYPSTHRVSQMPTIFKLQRLSMHCFMTS
jgi:hypothetical protein